MVMPEQLFILSVSLWAVDVAVDAEADSGYITYGGGMVYSADDSRARRMSPEEAFQQAQKFRSWGREAVLVPAVWGDL
jgi:hypothetical protein